jgi:aryl-alcohol dehydrogenase-like predicted oxidoreductase
LSATRTSLIPDDPNAGGAGRKAIIAQLDRSLSRLKTDNVDLYWQHMWDRHTPIEETLSTLNDLVRAGKAIAATGVTLARYALRRTEDNCSNSCYKLLLNIAFPMSESHDSYPSAQVQHERYIS